MQTREPIAELHDTLLYKLLSAIDQEYADRITRFVTGIAPILATTQRHFPYYTRHDAHHGFRVVRRMEQVLDWRARLLRAACAWRSLACVRHILARSSRSRRQSSACALVGG